MENIYDSELEYLGRAIAITRLNYAEEKDIEGKRELREVLARIYNNGYAKGYSQEQLTEQARSHFELIERAKEEAFINKLKSQGKVLISDQAEHRLRIIRHLAHTPADIKDLETTLA